MKIFIYIIEWQQNNDLHKQQGKLRGINRLERAGVGAREPMNE